jgi:predicted O-linked N-acetylglucosamine transferase (SPINDLY family)
VRRTGADVDADGRVFGSDRSEHNRMTRGGEGSRRPAGARASPAKDARLLDGLDRQRRGDLDGAAELYRAVLRQKPDDVDALHLLGLIYRDFGQIEPALAALTRAVELDGDFVEARNSLATALKRAGQREAALRQLRRAIDKRPDYAEAHNNLGNLLLDLGLRGEAISALDRAVRLQPDYAEAHGNLANALQVDGRLDDARTVYARALALAPGRAEFWSNLASLDQAGGDMPSALRGFRRSLAIADLPWSHSNYLFALHYDPQTSSESLYRSYRRWESIHARSCYRHIRPRRNSPDPERRLKIGYVSADFCDHPVQRNVEGLLANHDHGAFDIGFYADLRRHDAITDRLRGYADRWTPVTGATDADVAQRIVGDGIDVLVVLAGHTAHNRIGVAAFKPTPVQVSFHDLSTSGLSVMDYWLTDAVLNPESSEERLTETPWRLPCFYWHQTPDPSPEVGAPPLLRNGYVTFGSCNNPAKQAPEVLAAWASILAAVPGSRLLLKYLNRYSAPSLRRRVADIFAESGVAAERLNFVAGDCGRLDQLALLNEIDVALDPFPFNGSSTTFEALWMGTPVIALSGRRFLGRVGAAMLTEIGLPELVAADVLEYRSIAAGLAGDGDRLCRLRSTLRDRVLRSRLVDAAAYARSVEAAYRAMWRRWCQGR